MPKFKDITGEKHGRLTAVKYLGRQKWLWQCDCGKQTIVSRTAVIRGNTQSCGCLFHEKMIERNTTHGMRHTRLYNIWCSIKRRCYGENQPNYYLYGARNVRMCDEWLSFEPFMEWAFKTGYNDDLSIDRIDVNGNYCPENCRWADKYTQANNKRNNRLITYKGETHTIAEWSRITGLPYETLHYRNSHGWAAERTLTEPLRKVGKHK